jgi:hypothetical protein
MTSLFPVQLFVSLIVLHVSIDKMNKMLHNQARPNMDLSMCFHIWANMDGNRESDMEYMEWPGI